MGGRLNQAGWTPEIIELMAAMRGNTFRAIANEIFAQFGVSISETSVRVRMRSLGLAPEPTRTCVKRHVRRPPDDDAPPRPTLATRQRNTCIFPIDGDYICGKQRTFNSMDYCAAHFAKARCDGI